MLLVLSKLVNRNEGMIVSTGATTGDFKGSKNRILRVGEAVNNGIPIEQVDFETGEIINTLSSGRKAFEATGVGRIVIKRVLERRGKANGGGFFGDSKERHTGHGRIRNQQI